MSDPEIVIVGAGAAGLAAGAMLRRAGRDVLVLEAGDRIGGRARTSRPAGLHGAAIDEGATWLHAVDRNPLAGLARAAGDRLHPAHQGGRRLTIDDRTATAAEEAGYGTAEEAWRAQAVALADAPDRALAEVGTEWDADNPWLGNLEAWEGSIIAAADADCLSLHDWHRNLLDGDDLRPDDGMGALVVRRLGPPAGAVRLGVAVRTIDWSRRGEISLETSAGTVRTGACIVTVSTGVLRSGRIAFSPALPDALRDALDGLPMGLLSKLALPAAHDGARAKLGVAAGTLLEGRLRQRGDMLMLLGAWPDDAPYVTGFFGGRHAWSLAGRDADVFEAARVQLAAELGSDAAEAVATSGFASQWGVDPLFLGAYAYARPGHAGSRARLGHPFADGRVVLAGEACHSDGLAGTVGGAMLDGERAAGAVLQALGGRS